jgi:alkylation response protein AidB-like acyl-CoA dehydrogenase
MTTGIPAIIDSPALAQLCQVLAERAGELHTTDQWPAWQLQECARSNIFTWFIPPTLGGLGLSDEAILRGYLQLSQSCLTTSFILTQLMGGATRIAASENQVLSARLIPAILAGRSFATVAISHLTTSRRHVSQPAVRATPTADGYRLDGYSAWVTAADRAQYVVTGASLPDEQQLLIVVPTSVSGFCAERPESLVGLSASRTGRCEFHGVNLSAEWVLAGPRKNVLQSGRGVGTGGLQTSALALGLTAAALEYLEFESQLRTTLEAPAAALRDEWRLLREQLLATAAGVGGRTGEQLRRQANSLVLRATQAALAAAKGAGYAERHPAGRWCREALFFLVWSCPQEVVHANLCELAGLDSP